MTEKQSSKGFTALETVLVVLAVVVLAAGGWYVWQKQSKTESTDKNQSKNSEQTNQEPESEVNDPSEGGKYVLISEWGVKFPAPENLKGKVSYKITEATDPDNNLPLQAAKIFVTADSMPSNSCAAENTELGPSVNSGTQYVRADTSQPFNASRYKGTMKVDVLKTGNYSFNLNYITPDCADSEVIQTLQNALMDLQESK